jgi:hypothetical protein
MDKIVTFDKQIEILKAEALSWFKTMS